MGPRARGSRARVFSVRPENPDPEVRDGDYFDSWCRGVYRGRVDYEDGNGFVQEIKARFRFRVK